MAEGGNGDSAVYDCQKKAHKIFFEDELPNDFEPLPRKDWPSSIPKEWKGVVYDITGFYGQQVVALLSQIVNDKERFKKNETFYLLISYNSEGNRQARFEELFKLTARPSPPDQPGNGIVSLCPRGKRQFKQGSGTSYAQLNGASRAYHDKHDDKGKLMFSDTASFASDMKRLFKNNAQIGGLPQATIETYMLLLFEIARRLVKSEKPVRDKKPNKKKEYDVLPIGSAIARFIKLLDKRKCSFHNVFFPKEAFHCFTGEPKERRKAIEAINAKIKEILAEKGTATKEQSLKELQELFCSDQRLEEITSEKDQLAKTSKDLENLHLGEALSDAKVIPRSTIAN